MWILKGILWLFTPDKETFKLMGVAMLGMLVFFVVVGLFNSIGWGFLGLGLLFALFVKLIKWV